MDERTNVRRPPAIDQGRAHSDVQLIDGTAQQLVSKGESLITFENVLERVELVRLELVRWTKTEPAHVDALDARPPASPDNGVHSAGACPSRAQCVGRTS